MSETSHLQPPSSDDPRIIHGARRPRVSWLPLFLGDLERLGPTLAILWANQDFPQFTITPERSADWESQKNAAVILRLETRRFCFCFYDQNWDSSICPMLSNPGWSFQEGGWIRRELFWHQMCITPQIRKMMQVCRNPPPTSRRRNESSRLVLVARSSLCSQPVRQNQKASCMWGVHSIDPHISIFWVLHELSERFRSSWSKTIFIQDQTGRGIPDLFSPRMRSHPAPLSARHASIAPSSAPVPPTSYYRAEFNPSPTSVAPKVAIRSAPRLPESTSRIVSHREVLNVGNVQSEPGACLCVC